MKKIISLFAIASIFAACNSKSDLDTQKDVIVTDTSKMYNSNASTDISSAKLPAPAAQPAPQAVQTRTIIRERTVYIDRTPKATKQTVREADPVAPVAATVPQSPANTGTATTQSSGTGSTASTDAGNTLPTETPVDKKKGWSNAAKDAVIAGGVGAVGGAILGKNKVKGAVIGGVIGAAGGYIFGRKKDKSVAADGANYAVYQ